MTKIYDSSLLISIGEEKQSKLRAELEALELLTYQIADGRAKLEAIQKEMLLEVESVYLEEFADWSTKFLILDKALAAIEECQFGLRTKMREVREKNNDASRLKRRHGKQGI